MAGIAGTVDLSKGLGPAEPLVRGMLATLRHRGPDGESLVADGPAMLGARLLAVQGPASAAAVDRPLRLVLDGDVLNCDEVRRSLRAERAAPGGASQAETVLAAWQELGPRCLALLEGTFAFALWDGESRRLYCVRDAIGGRPLYHASVAGRFRFASEAKALLADERVPRVPNDARILQYLAHGIADHTEETMLRDVRQVPVGSYAVASARGGVEIVRWHRFRPVPAEGPVADRVRTLLEEAVALRLRGPGVVGATLSGGLDSTSVLATAAVLRQRAGEEPPLAVVARAADPGIDEWRYAELLVRRYGIPVVEVRPDDARLVDDFDAFAWSLDEPCHSPSVYGHWRTMQAAREAGVDVVLEGQCGERFGGLGYWYPHLFYDMLSRGRAADAVRELGGRRRVQGVAASQSLLELAKLLLPRRLRAARAHVPPWVRRDGVEPPPLPPRGLLALQVHEMTVFDEPLLNREIDRDAASSSLVARSPFQDGRIAAYALSLHAETLHRGGWGKAPILDAMRGRVPDEILDRPRKQGFTVDQDRWIRGALGVEIERVFRSEAARSRPYWDAEAVLRRLEECRAGRASAVELWRAYSVERWLELTVEGRPRSGRVVASVDRRAVEHV